MWGWVDLKASLRELDFTIACIAALLWQKSFHFQGCTCETEVGETQLLKVRKITCRSKVL